MGKNKITIYCDGSARNNKKNTTKIPYGSFSSIVYLNDKLLFEVTEGFNGVTNNQMEVLGFIFPIVILKKNYNEIFHLCDIEVVSDSQYLIKGINEWLHGWIKKNWHTTSGAVKNKELWVMIVSILNEVKQKNNDYICTWVRGHNDHPLNESCDSNCTEKVKKLDSGQEEPLCYEDIIRKFSKFFK